MSLRGLDAWITGHYGTQQQLGSNHPPTCFFCQKGDHAHCTAGRYEGCSCWMREHKEKA